jgi:hypothetical protein
MQTAGVELTLTLHSFCANSQNCDIICENFKLDLQESARILIKYILRADIGHRVL